MYYCNCVEAWEAQGYHRPGEHSSSGKNLPNTPAVRDDNLYNFQLVEVCKEDLCIHCGYTALFSRGPLDSAGEPIQAAK